MKGFDRILGDPAAPYNLTTKIKVGDIYEGRPPYPRVKVTETEQTRVREMRWQRIRVRASAQESNYSEDVQVMRLVAILEDDTEVELSRVAVPADMLEEEKADLSICASCGKKIPVGAAQVHKGKAYHAGRCIQ